MHTSVWLLWFVKEEETGPSVQLLIGVYSSRVEADAAMARHRDRPGFRENPEGFIAEPYRVDRDHYNAGYITTRVAPTA